MDRAEYQITFMTFFIGLGVADLFSSLVRMLKRRGDITWHWLPLIWSATAFLGLIIAWLAYQNMFTMEFTSTGPGFLLAISPAIFIFAFTVSILPHDIPEKGVNLRDYYFTQKKLIFSLAFMDMTTRAATQIFILNSLKSSMPLEAWIPILAMQLLVVGLIFLKNYYYHCVVSVLFFLFYLSLLINSSLGG